MRIYQIEKIPVWKSFTGLVGGGGFMTLGGVVERNREIEVYFNDVILIILRQEKNQSKIHC